MDIGKYYKSDSKVAACVCQTAIPICKGFINVINGVGLGNKYCALPHRLPSSLPSVEQRTRACWWQPEILGSYYYTTNKQES